MLTCWEEAEWASDAIGPCALNEGVEFADAIDRVDIDDEHPRNATAEGDISEADAQALIAALAGSWSRRTGRRTDTYTFEGTTLTRTRVEEGRDGEDDETTTETFRFEVIGPHGLRVTSDESDRSEDYSLYVDAENDRIYFTDQGSRFVHPRSDDRPDFFRDADAMVVAIDLDTDAPKCQMVGEDGSRVEGAGCTYEDDDGERLLVLSGTTGQDWDGDDGRSVDDDFVVFEDAIVPWWTFGWHTRADG